MGRDGDFQSSCEIFRDGFGVGRVGRQIQCPAFLDGYERIFTRHYLRKIEAAVGVALVGAPGFAACVLVFRNQQEEDAGSGFSVLASEAVEDGGGFGDGGCQGDGLAADGDEASAHGGPCGGEVGDGHGIFAGADDQFIDAGVQRVNVEAAVGFELGGEAVFAFLRFEHEVERCGELSAACGQEL